MNLIKIKEILSNGFLEDDTKKHLILMAIAEDKDAIPTVLELLSIERKKQKRLIGDMNFQLSRAYLGLQKPELNDNHFMDKEIGWFFHDNKDEKQIGPLFSKLEDMEPRPPDKLKTLNYEDYD